MSTRIVRFLVSSAVLLTAVFLMVPTETFAATAKAKGIAYDLYNPKRSYGDEKKDIVNPTSRCNTVAMRKLHASNLVRAEKDLEVLPISTTTPALADLYETYLEKLDLSWGAMEEPYCGFGAFGAKAAINSYTKSVNRTRAEFLTAARKIKAE